MVSDYVYCVFKQQANKPLELESCIVFGQPSHSLGINNSELHKKHQEVLMFSANQGFSSDVTNMLCELVKHNGDLQLLTGNLSEICSKANNGAIFSGRRLEIEVLHAGKVCLAQVLRDLRISHANNHD